MSKQRAGARLVEKATVGLKDLPVNASWLWSRVSSGGVADVADKARDTWRSASATVQDASPIGDTSVEVRIKRAREAGERANRAEAEALEAATTAKRLADDAATLEQEGRAHVRSVKAETSAEVKARVAEAKERAERQVRAEREVAQEQADKLVARAESDVQSRLSEANDRAEVAQEKAHAKVARASELLAEARRLADEAADAASKAALSALDDAKRLAEEADRQASEATQGLAEAEAVQEETSGSAAGIAADLRSGKDGGLNGMTKVELVDLATALGLERPQSMKKADLVAAVSRESRKGR